jgi:hypothetical protein
MKTAHLALATATVITAASWQTAYAAFSYDFEAPDFHVGPIHGQQGYLNWQGGIAIDTANPYSGSQHMRLSKEPGSGSVLAMNTYSSNPGTFYSTSFQMYRHSDLMYVDFRGMQTDATQSWALRTYNQKIYIREGSSFVLTQIPVVVTSGAYHEFEVVYNPGSMTRDYFFNGTRIHHQTTGLLPGTSTNLLEVGIPGASSGTADIDDITFEAVPAPGSIALTGLAALVAARRRR